MMGPTGWHAATDSEWSVMLQYLVDNGFGYGGIGEYIAKSLANTSGWNISSSGGAVGFNQATNNNTGFTTSPSGMRDAGQFHSMGSISIWWAAPGTDLSTSWYRRIEYAVSSVSRSTFTKENGLSVRCIKD